MESKTSSEPADEDIITVPWISADGKTAGTQEMTYGEWNRRRGFTPSRSLLSRLLSRLTRNQDREPE